MATVKPILSFCVKSNCSKLTITDTTGLWNNTSGTQKWSNTQVPGGVELSDILDSYVELTKYGTTTPLVFTLRDQTNIDLYPTEASVNFSFTDFNWTTGDGIYAVELFMTLDNAHTYLPFTTNILITCQAEACIKELWKKYYKQSCKDNKELYENALYAEALLKGVQAEFLCNQTQKANKILTLLGKVCKIASDNCGCN